MTSFHCLYLSDTNTAYITITDIPYLDCSRKEARVNRYTKQMSILCRFFPHWHLHSHNLRTEIYVTLVYIFPQSVCVNITATSLLLAHITKLPMSTAIASPEDCSAVSYKPVNQSMCLFVWMYVCINVFCQFVCDHFSKFSTIYK